MSINKIYRTFILEDKYFERSAIEKILGGIPEITIVGNADTTAIALDWCERLKPDLIIADAKIGQDKLAGASFVRYIRTILPNVRILGITYHADLVDSLERAGCDYVVNKALIENQEAAVKYIRETLLPKPAFFRAFKPPQLTEHQDRVLHYICEGLTEDDIARELGFDNRRPVRNIKNTLFEIFGAVSAANLVHLAYQCGYLNPDKR